MSILLLILLWLVQKGQALQEDWINTLIGRISSELTTHQIITFTNQTKIKSKSGEDDVLRKLMQKVPVLYIDLSDVNYSDANRSLSLPFFANPRQSSVYIILINSNDIELQSIIDFLSMHSSLNAQPKTLVVTYYNKKQPDTDYETILSYAWSKKFLDFSIIDISVDNNVTNYKPFIFNFNPFYNSTTKQHLCPNTLVFPDKLKNLNRYPLKIPIFHFPPYIMVNESRRGKIINASGITLPLIITVAKTMKFSIESPVTVRKYATKKSWKNIVLKKLEENVIDVVSVPLIDFVGREFLQIYDGLGCIEYIAIVPILKAEKLNVSLYNFYYLFIIILIFMILVYFSNRFTLKVERWNFSNVIQLILGQSIRRIPQKTFNKIIFLTISSTYIVYCNVRLSSLVNAKVINYEVPFSTFEEISESRLNVYVEKIFYERIFNFTDNPDIQKMRQRTIIVNDIKQCVENLRYNRSSICITSKFKAKTIVERYVKNDKTRKMKIAKPTFLCEYSALIIQKGSPYFEKFEQIIRWIAQSGIYNAWEDVRKFEMIPNYGTGKAVVEKVFLLEGYFVLFIGCLLSVVIFFVEKIMKMG